MSSHLDTDLTCWNCKGFLKGADNLVPVTDGQYFDVACTHKLPRLRRWRRLTAKELAEFNRMSDELVEALKSASKRRTKCQPLTLSK